MTIRLNGQTAGYVELKSPDNAGSNTLVLPTGNGSSGQYLQTNGSGTLSWQTVASLSNAEDGTGTDFEFNSGYGSNATAYGCRAWVNFNGTGTVSVTQSGNVSSITDQGTGTYDVNFSTAMPDANYCVTTDVGALTSGGTMPGNIATGSFRMLTMDGNFANIDRNPVFAAVFR